MEAHLGDLAIEEALWLAGRIAEGIQQGHRHGVAHLDLKPSNVLLRDTPDGKFPYPKISDWGLAELLLDQSKGVEGLSPPHAAPEQFDTDEYGNTDNITDIYISIWNNPIRSLYWRATVYWFRHLRDARCANQITNATV